MADTITLGPEDGTLRLHTTRTGPAARMGHDLTIEVRRWSATVTLTEDGSEIASLTASAEADSCEVVEGGGGAKALTDKDKQDIHKAIAEKVLRVDRHPQVAFEGSTVVGSTIKGQLTLVGTVRPWELHCNVSGERVQATGSIDQTHFGIKPYSTLFGALKVGEVVVVSVDVRNPRA